MDLSLQQRPHVTHAMPVLRVFEIGRLLLHEEPDLGRVRRLQDALRRDGVLRNPPIVAPLPEGMAAVLDGANRVTALREAGIPHAVVQVVEYGRSEITLSSWRHYVREDEPESLRDRVADLPGIHAAELRDPLEAVARLAHREGAAAVIDARGGTLLGGGADPVGAAEMLNRIVALYRGQGRIYRIEGGDDLDALAADYGRGTLVVFRTFEKADILLIAARGGRLPTGITRHIIPGRALRVNAPLDWLAGPSDAAAKQVRLDASLRQRWLDHGVRHYAESTFLFDE
jgi:L-serine kinase (ATP) / ParB family transcriptional regulator, heme-responsive regulator